MRNRGPALWFAVGCGAVFAATAPAAEPAVTVLADFEDASVAARIAAVRNVLAGDCGLSRTAVPARGQGSLVVEIGATAREVSVACDLTFREPTRFDQADRIATFCWINAGEFELTFRLRDARDQLFETQPQAVRLPHRWVYVSADLRADRLRRRTGSGSLTYPIQVQGYRVTAHQLGKQRVFLDDLQVEQRVPPRDLIHGTFEFNEPTRIYTPGASVRAAVVLENRSRRQALSLAVELAWMRPDGSVLQQQRASVQLPASGIDFRSHRRLDFSQRIREPGLYRLVARARGHGWAGPNTFETTIAVTPSNRGLARGRSTFFGVRSNLLREPVLDQMLEIRVARDIGVNLLALDVPWAALEPKPGSFDFNQLAAVIAAATQAPRDMAVMLVLTTPPEWVSGRSAPHDEIVAVLSALARRFGARIQQVQLDGSVLNLPTVTARVDAARELRARVQASHPNLEVLPPPIPVDGSALDFDVTAFGAAHPGCPLVFETRGNVADALQALAGSTERQGFRWRALHWWQHRAQPLAGSGHFDDAEAVLRHFVAAARAGVRGLIWFDLRDDDNHPSQRPALRGLVRRDFSPKTSLLGYATAAGQLTGYRYAGEVYGTPEAFDSALFIGADQHIAVLLPRAGRILPAVLAPISGVPGIFGVQDFERRTRPVHTSVASPLVTTIPRPLFISLRLDNPQPEPQLGLARPWLRVPATVFCGADAEFAIEVQPPVRLRQSYLQFRLPPDSPIESSLAAVALRGEAGETQRYVVRLVSRTGQDFEKTELLLRLGLEGELLEIPLTVRALTIVDPLAAGDSITRRAHRIARPIPPDGERRPATVQLHCAYEPDTLHLAVIVEDDRVVPYGVSDGNVGGDQLLLGVVRAGRADPVEARIDPAASEPELLPLSETTTPSFRGWHCRRRSAKRGDALAYHFTIPAAALGGPALVPGDRILVAVQYVDDDAHGQPPATLRWGGGLDGSRSTAEYRWIQLGPGATEPDS